MTTFVLVPGAFRGGWWYEPLAGELRLHGHQVHALTLTGLGARRHLSTAVVNLDTHIQDVVSLLEAERIEAAVLVGHGYGGMPVTGAADRLPERVDTLVYLDAFVPGDGDSAWSLSPEPRQRRLLAGVGTDGATLTPPPVLLGDPRIAPHPLAAYLQRIRLTGAQERVRQRDYIHLSESAETPITPFRGGPCRDDGWTVHTLPTGHDVMSEAPDDLLEILLTIGEPPRPAGRRCQRWTRPRATV
ncbi:alpha/beta fold hydrolase [Streptomyces sp. SP17BM10]|uniref:alpha/beta fold hydrolase n=1 Tax=Streptomyces sp. SP17BM10 TaxID=3002530 RepID=UPI002E7892CE|nr:alpha/beta fold hydrolase [Streptomyces sp. SP17BM10]MEE1783530.1 alpha/beta fold hydrolase [Streptomyces sp. SP17BM10]